MWPKYNRRQKGGIEICRVWLWMYVRRKKNWRVAYECREGKFFFLLIQFDERAHLLHNGMWILFRSLLSGECVELLNPSARYLPLIGFRPFSFVLYIIWSKVSIIVSAIPSFLCYIVSAILNNLCAQNWKHLNNAARVYLHSVSNLCNSNWHLTVFILCLSPFAFHLWQAGLLLELPREQLLNWIFECLVELHASLPALIKY